MQAKTVREPAQAEFLKDLVGRLTAGGREREAYKVWQELSTELTENGPA